MSFPLICNEKIKVSLSSALSVGRIPHAIILEGETGLDKHTLADFISISALCEEDGGSCGNCRSCHLAKSGNHPDIISVTPEDKKKNISVAQIREIRQKAFIKPHISKKRVFIIDKAETMNEQAQNALLKILEEPPESVIFILITESGAALLPTVISRCVTYRMYVPSISAAEEWIISNKKVKADQETVHSAVSSAKGNIGRALEILRKKNSSPAEAAAKEFASVMLFADEFELLTLLSEFEKDRPAADTFLSALKYETVQLLKENYLNNGKAKTLTEIYNRIDGFLDALKTNINLALLFSTIVCTVKQLCRDYLE